MSSKQFCFTWEWLNNNIVVCSKTLCHYSALIHCTLYIVYTCTYIRGTMSSMFTGCYVIQHNNLLLIHTHTHTHTLTQPIPLYLMVKATQAHMKTPGTDELS